VIVVPWRFDVRRVPFIVEAHKGWISRAATRIARRRETCRSEDTMALPERIHLRAIDRKWTVEYRATRSSRVTVVERPGERLLLTGAVGNDEACRRALRRWLHRVASRHLTGHLREIATGNGFVLNRVTVRSQRTRWASCSRNGTVSLNIRLLFVPPELMHHVLVHELCHTVHMDHSLRFRSLLEGHDPKWREHRHALRGVWNEVPAWAVGPGMSGVSDEGKARGTVI
jgi:predicted metal-dependent hydrolase